MLSTVATFNKLPEAYILRGRLLAEDIPAWVTNEYQIAIDWFYATARHGAWVQVSAINETEAFEIVRAAMAGEFKALLAEQFGEIDELRCPQCGTTDCWKRRPLIRGAVAILFGVLTRTIPPLLRWIYFCNACGNRFHSQYGLVGKADGRSQFELNFAEAAVGDIPEMMDVRLLAQQNTLRASPEQDAARYRFQLNAGENGWICRVGGFLRGFAIIDTGTRQLSAVFVHPYFKRDGIGRYLHNAAVDRLFAQNNAPIQVVTEPGTDAERFFRKAGWRLVAENEHGDYLYELMSEIWHVRRKKF
jgi:hypothetical protein